MLWKLDDDHSFSALGINCCGAFYLFGRVFPGTAAFQLYSSMGFPLDLLTLMAEEKVR